ncbi:MAG TPA: hypothetical protein DCX54_05725 [Flavobacteriales bacterium]|nr:hypothetical protein [Flavobacteriales bacterium]
MPESLNLDERKALLIPTVYIITALLLLGYVLLMIYTRGGLDKENSSIQIDRIRDLKLSVVAPFRDEEKNLPDFLQSIKKQDYNKNDFELLMVDDHSSDGGPGIINRFIAENDLNVRIIKLEKAEASKKKAIEKGIENATGQIIVTTDADTLRNEKWLTSISRHFMSGQTELLIAPVLLTGTSFTQAFQRMEFNALQYITMCFAANHNAVLCNGANLAYKKDLFGRMNGFRSNEGISSGDDVFLLFQLKKENRNAIAFTVDPNAVVRTEALTSIFELLNQKIRWASKSIRIDDVSFILLSLLVICSNIWMICLLPLELKFHTWPVLSFLYLSVKCIFDYMMIKRIEALHHSRISPVVFVLSYLLYPFYLAAVFLLSKFKPATWKGRIVRT